VRRSSPGVGQATLLALVLASPLTGLAWTPDPEHTANLERAWQRYLKEDSRREPSLRFPYGHCFRQAAGSYGLPVSLLLAVARGESDFDPNARSPANAHGLMQILWPTTARHLGVYRLAELYEPCRNVDAGARYLKELLERYEGDLHLALAAYNYGPERIARGSPLPAGARWYSGYIYRHLGYVLGVDTAQKRPGGAGERYRDQGRLELAVFREPYRAQAFVETLQRSAPGVRLDWFRAGSGRFRVLLFYAGEAELRESRRLLARAGFSL
jgi:hypothetical protein